MALPARPMHVPSGLPIDEATRLELLEVGAANRLNVNVRMDHRGCASKRLGYKLFASDGLSATAVRRLDAANQDDYAIDFTTRTDGRRLFAIDRQPCVIDGTYLDTFSPAVDSWVSKSRVPEATYRLVNAPTVGMSHPVDDVVVCNGVVVVAHTFNVPNVSSGVDLSAVVTVLDAEDFGVIRPTEAIDGATASTAIRTRLAKYGTTVVAIIFDTTAGEIRAWYLSVASRTSIAAGWVSIGTVASDFSGDNADAGSLSNRVSIVYPNDSAGTSRLTVKTLTSAGVVETVNINTSSLDPHGPSVSEDSSTLWVAWGEEVAGGPPTVTNFKVVGLNPSDIDGTAFATVATVISTSRVGWGGGHTWVVDTGSGTGALYAINEDVFNTDGTTFRTFATTAGAVVPTAGFGAGGLKLANSVPMGRPLYRGGRVYIPMTSLTLEEIVICDCTEGPTWRPVVVPVQRGQFNILTSNPRARIASTDSNTYVFAFNVLKAGDALNGINGTAMAELDFTDPDRWRTARLGRSTFIGSGMLSVFDGRRVFEAAFLCRPPAPSVDVASAGSQTFAAGRSYVVTYEEVDNNGDWHVSGVSNPTATGAITTQTVEVSVVPLSITARSDDSLAPFGARLRIGIWGTTDGGQLYYRMATLENYQFQESVTWEDDLAEGDFTSNALLYATGSLPGTNGSSQDHRAPPGLKHLVSYNGMLVGTAGNAIYNSSQPIDGQGTWFSPVFVQMIDEDATGIAVQDGSVIVFSRSSVWTGAGEPPSDNAAIGGMGVFRKLSVDTGCINSNSIVATSIGIFFQSARGIELLTRAGAVQWIGEQVQNTLASYPYISSAVLDDKNSLVRFSLAASESDGIASGDGRDVIFDLSIGGWVSVDQKLEVDGGDYTPSQDAAMIYADGAWRYAWLNGDGEVYYERDADDASACLDGSDFVPAEYELPPWKLGLQQEQRIYEMELLFERHSACGLEVDVAYDYGAYTETKEWTEAVLAGQRQVPFRPNPQGTAVQLRVRDTAPAVLGTGRGLSFVGISADIAPKQGPTRGTTRLNPDLRR